MEENLDLMEQLCGLVGRGPVDHDVVGAGLMVVGGIAIVCAIRQWGLPKAPADLIPWVMGMVVLILVVAVGGSIVARCPIPPPLL